MITMRNMRLSIGKSETDKGFRYAHFQHNGREVKMLITELEYKKALQLIKNKDEAGIDDFCYSIV